MGEKMRKFIAIVFGLLVLVTGCAKIRPYVKFDDSMQCETTCKGKGKVSISSHDVDHMDLQPISTDKGNHEN